MLLAFKAVSKCRKESEADVSLGSQNLQEDISLGHKPKFLDVLPF